MDKNKRRVLRGAFLFIFYKSFTTPICGLRVRPGAALALLRGCGARGTLAPLVRALRFRAGRPCAEILNRWW
jgi:hypothetical protein